MKYLLLVVGIIGIGALCFAAGEKVGIARFSDVPADHWAADAVTELADQGVLQGYPDGTFNGERAVTRYELAVTLARFAEFMNAGRNPLVQPDSTKSRSIIPEECPSWAQDSVLFLSENSILPVDSPIITDGKKFATGEDVAQSLSSLAARFIELEVADPGPEDIE